MSTGANCYFQEVKPAEWYYVLEDYNAPKNAWDWREYATAYGPFGSFDQARTHLHKHHANPGGYDRCEYDESYKPDEMEAQLFADARKNKMALANPYRAVRRPW